MLRSSMYRFPFGIRYTLCGQSLYAFDTGMAEWTPYLRASYEHADTTPRVPGNAPTITGFPARSGLSFTSTAAKKQSMSTWMMEGMGDSRFFFGKEHL